MPDDPPVIPTPDPVDIAIVGAGPIGLFAAFYAGMRQMSVKVIDGHDSVGGQLSAFYPTDPIYDVPGFASVPATQLVSSLVKQADQAAPTWCLSQEVQQIHPLPTSGHQHWQLVTKTAIHSVKAVLLALGVGAIRNKQFNFLDPSVRFTNVYTALTDIERFRDKDVVVSGGRDRAIQNTTALLSVARRVTLICPSALEPDLFLGQVTVLPYHRIVQTGCQAVQVSSVTVEDIKHGGVRTIPTDALLISPHLETSLKPILEWGLELEGSGIRVNPDMRTNRNGVYAAGDVAVYPGKVKLIAVGFGEAAIAVNHIKHYLDPTQKVFPGYSTSVAPRRLARLADEQP